MQQAVVLDRVADGVWGAQNWKILLEKFAQEGIILR